MYLGTTSTAASNTVAMPAPYRDQGRQSACNIAVLGLPQHVEAGGTVFCEGDQAENVYEVVSGMLRLYKALPDGRRQITGFLSHGHLLGIAADDRHVYTAEAVTDVTLRRFPRRRFERMIEEVPGLARRVLSATSNELCVAQDQMLLLGRKSADEKIASFLIMLAGRQGPGDAAASVFVPMKRSDMADYLGLTVETVSRALARLKREGMIALAAHAYVDLIDRDRLKELAAGEVAYA